LADTFKTGDEFLAMFDSIPSYRPACIVLDVQVPGLNGREVHQRLASNGIPVDSYNGTRRDQCSSAVFVSGRCGVSAQTP
jgi:CheY-like chemotaxis protein